MSREDAAAAGNRFDARARRLGPPTLRQSILSYISLDNRSPSFLLILRQKLSRQDFPSPSLCEIAPLHSSGSVKFFPQAIWIIKKEQFADYVCEMISSKGAQLENVTNWKSEKLHSRERDSVEQTGYLEINSASKLVIIFRGDPPAPRECPGALCLLW